MTNTTLPPNRPEGASTLDYANSPAYVLSMTGRYLLEAAYGPYRLAVSRHIEDTARLAALTVYAGHVAPQPVTFTAWTGDPAACTITALAALLLPTGVIMSASAFHPSNPVVKVAGLDMDVRTGTLIDMQLLPSHARMDAGHVRNRIADSARANRLAVIDASERRACSVLCAVAGLAGGDWPRVARLLAGGIDGR
ncbi:hypothetical protein [Bifidobacterium avesanii]|uniref:Uncharacterized protein n=1 Tax=Bifidobacterium avesanii TaxID=1798157 RepID=A0A7K3TG33_9BIFI|nr:hypothetical protein [Bifidobacterium avesanii]KAB8294537.1 3-methyl-2-oxobutanoate hydroxymethyltransferase [Bifidobacterium avesanii]NEG78048.1 hypothetical protein [Bifidobacterium avesanii]